MQSSGDQQVALIGDDRTEGKTAHHPGGSSDFHRKGFCLAPGHGMMNLKVFLLLNHVDLHVVMIV